MPFDLTRVRHDTPACEHVIHLNNAGAALMPQSVLDATMQHVQLEARIGGYEAAEHHYAQIEHVYDAVATLLGCHQDEVAILENATRAWHMAFYSIPFQRGDRILTSSAEYASNYIAFLHMARKTGVSIEVIPNDEHGQLSIEALQEAIDERVKLIAITHVPSNGGLVNPAAAVGQVAGAHGILYLLDACQSVGQMPVDVQAIGCDMLSSTGRKYLRGPRGTGFLYVRHAILDQLEPPMLGLDAAQWVERDRYELCDTSRRFESWETNPATKIGLAVAIDYALNLGIESIWVRIRKLAEQLRSQLKLIQGVTVHDIGTTQCGIVTFTVVGRRPEEIYDALTKHHINVWVSLRSSTRIDMEARGLTNILRASVHYYNSEEEIEYFCTTLRVIVEHKSTSSGWISPSLARFLELNVDPPRAITTGNTVRGSTYVPQADPQDL